MSRQFIDQVRATFGKTLGRRTQVTVIDPVDLRGLHPDTAYVKPEPGTATGFAGRTVMYGGELTSIAPRGTTRPGDGGRDRQDRTRAEHHTLQPGIVQHRSSRYTKPPLMTRRARRRRANRIAKASRKANR